MDDRLMDLTAITAALSTIMGIPAPGIPDVTVQRIVAALIGRSGGSGLADATAYTAAWLESEVQAWEAYVAAHSPLVLASAPAPAS